MLGATNPILEKLSLVIVWAFVLLIAGATLIGLVGMFFFAIRRLVTLLRREHDGA